MKINELDVALEFCPKCQKNKLAIDMVNEEMCLDCYTNLIDAAHDAGR